MLNAISGSNTSRRSPSMDAQLSAARARLGDWVTCPSAKTPEGKTEIKKATEKLESVKAEIKQADDSAAKPVGANAADSRPLQADRPANELQGEPAIFDNRLEELGRTSKSTRSQFGPSQNLGGRLNVQA